MPLSRFIKLGSVSVGATVAPSEMFFLFLFFYLVLSSNMIFRKLSVIDQ